MRALRIPRPVVVYFVSGVLVAGLSAPAASANTPTEAITETSIETTDERAKEASISPAVGNPDELSQLLTRVEATPQPSPIPMADEDISILSPNTNHTPGPVVAASASATEEPPRIPVETWEYDGVTDYEYLTDGFLRYARTPAAFVVPGEGRRGYEMRGFSGLPQIPSQNRGSDVCVPSSEGKFIKAPTTTPDWCGGIMDRQDMMCHLEPYGELLDNPLANYSYGTDWTVYVKYRVDRLHIDGTPTSTTRKMLLPWEYAVQWGVCDPYVYLIPFKDPYDCPIEIDSFTSRGPYGKGLPTVNNFTGQTIPESETDTVSYEVPGQSPLGEAWNGGKLYGLGENADSIALVERCRQWKAELPEASPDYYGNWDYTVRTLMTTCIIIRYPGYEQSSFQGCDPPYTATDRYTKNVQCVPGEPQGSPRIRSGRDDDTSFTPEAMGCYSVTCDWTYPDGTEEVGNGEGYPLIKQDKSDDIIIDRGERAIRAYADGVQWKFKYPKVEIGTVATRGADATPVNGKWTLFEVKPGSSPWNPRVPREANSTEQWFFTEAEDVDRVLTLSFRDDPYCVPGVDACVERGDIASIAGGEAAVPVNSMGPGGRRDFAYDFGINFYSASGYEKLYSVQGLHQQRHKGDYSLPSTLTIMANDVYLGGRNLLEYTTITTCATGWTNLSVLRPRVSP